MKKILTLLLGIILLTGCTKDDKANETNTDSGTSIKIGAQTWTTKNLDLVTYSDGTLIPEVQDAEAWSKLTTGAWCYHNSYSATGAIYGKLYNWYAVAGIWNEASKIDAEKRKKLAPTGWHIPSDTEWNTLVNYLDPKANGGDNSSNIAGGKMKEKGTNHWYSPNQDATDLIGFTGLPGGYRNFDGMFYDIGYYGFWWSSSVNEAPYAWFRMLDYNYGNVGRYSNFKTNGFSVRCLRD